MGVFTPGDFAAERVEQCFNIARWLDSEGGWTQASNPFPFCYPDAIQYFTPVQERGDEPTRRKVLT